MPRKQVHCQGGKGRSGTFCSSLLLWTGFLTYASDAMQAFAKRRADERIQSSHYQGVTGPSQIRYINYIEEIVLNGIEYVVPPKTLVTSIKIRSLPLHYKGTIRISFVIESLGTIQYDYGKRHGLAELSQRGESPAGTEFCFNTEDTLVGGDVCVRFFVFEETSLVPLQQSELGPGARTIRYGSVIGKQLCFVTFHTSFHRNDEKIIFERSEIDGAHDRPDDEFLGVFSICVTCQNTGAKSQRRTRNRRSSATDPAKLYLKPLVMPVQMEPAAHPAAICEDNFEQALRPHDDTDADREMTHIPYGTAPGRRLLRLCEVLAGIVGRQASSSISFKKGEVMYDPTKCSEHRCLYFIVSGNAEYESGNCDERRRPARINRGDSISGVPLGAGDCYGVLSFLLGQDGDIKSFKIRATSQEVQVTFPRIQNIEEEEKFDRCFLAGQNFQYVGGTHGNSSNNVQRTIHPLFFAHFRSAGNVAFNQRSISVNTSVHALNQCKNTVTPFFIQSFPDARPLQPNNVKRDAHLGARDAQFVQNALRKLGLADRVVRMAKATLHSRTGGDSWGFLLVFPHKCLFYETVSLRFRKQHLRVFFKDVLSVTSNGNTLTIIVMGEQAKEGKQKVAPVSSVGSAESKGRTGRRGSELLGIVPFSKQSSSSKSKARVKDQFRDINAVANVVSTSSKGHSRLSVKYQLRGELECLEIRGLITDFVEEIKKTMLSSLQKDSHSFSDSSQKGQNENHTFGYIMPGEVVHEDALEGIEQILAHAKSCTYRPGDEILRRGCTERKRYHITAGIAACTSSNGQVTARMGPGEVFGDNTFLDTGDVGVEETIVAEEAVECLVVARDTVEMLAALHPEAGARFWRSLAVSAACSLRHQYAALEARGRAVEAASIQPTSM